MECNSPIVFAIVEEKDTGIFICAIINYLVTLQNNFLQEITKIPNGSCKSLKFLEKPPQVDVGSTSSDDSSSSSTTAQANNPQVSNQYYIQSSRASQLRKSNVIDYEWDEDILQYSQRILTIGHGDDVIYDLKKIELELAYWLGFDKAYIETVQDSQLYLEPFSYHMELFQGYSRILSDIKNIIPQEPIPTEKLSLIRGEVGNINNNIFVSSPQYTNNYSLDDANNILSSLEVLLCFIKHNAIGQEDMLIQDYVKQWMKLSLLMMKPAFANLLNADLSLKHIVALYEFVEEQVANRVIEYIDDVYKEGLTLEQENEIVAVVDFTNNQQKSTLTIKQKAKKIPADALIVALKRFTLRFLSVESKDYSNEPLNVYLTNMDLNFWFSEIDQATIDLFPDTLLVSHTFRIYKFCVSQLEAVIRRQIHESKIKKTTGQNSNNTKKDRTQEWLETSSEPNWQNKVASDKKLLYPYSSFSGALQAYLRIFIRKPIAKLLCAIERLSATRTLLLIDRPRKIEEVEQSHKLLEFWIECFMDPKIVNTEDIPDPKPDVYTMPANNYDLEFPFSLYFMKRIDSFKRLFEDEINQHKENEGNIDEQTGELYQHFFNDYTKGFSTTVINSIPSFKKSSLNLFPDLYFNDFVAVSSSAGNRNLKVLSFLLQRFMGEEKFLDPVFLHAYWWRNSNTVLAEFQLTQICPMVISKITACNNSESFEHSLVREIAGIMLQNISESRNLTYNSYMFEQWQRDVTKILSFGAKVLKGQPLPSLQILRICNDFISTKAIPLANVKEIITIGKNSSQKEMLSAEFINKVFDILYKMEPNEKNLISRRSFILRCLDIVDLESKLRLQLYGKIFSQRPFPLMSAIIQRIFLQEDEDEDESIFLTILENPGLAIRDSARLNVINTCLKNQGLDSMMSTLCCDVIQTLFETFELSDLANYFGFAAKAITNLGTEALQKITAIAFLKVFVEGFWNECIQRHNYQQPIVFDLMETDGAVLIKEINDFMSIPNPLIHSLKIYFLRILRNRHNLPLNDVKQFCNRQNRTLPWLASIAWEDNSQNRLSFNPYWALDMYAEADKGFSSLYSLKNN
ncbi:1969_t:CDS:2 [Entrophospora sp. SA101]|nr:1969_t:CDS:2 [Entrophospora sp. SA101]